MKRFLKEELLFDMPFYAIFMVLGDGWFVANKINKSVKRFSFKEHSYLDVMEYAETIC